MGTVTIITEMTSIETGPLNPAIITAAFDDAVGTRAEIMARCAMYNLLAVSVVRTDTAITAIRTVQEPGGASVPQPFPTAEMTTLWNDLNATFQATIADPYQYGDVTARAVAPSIRGGSVCMNETTSTPAIVRGGKHFHPFLSADAVDSDGLIAFAAATLLIRLYDATFLGVAGADPFWATVPPALAPVVWSRKNSVAGPITAAAPQRIPSRLRSRTR